jgi:hypothetical protein
VFGCQENRTEHRSVCMLCLVGKKVKENNGKGFRPSSWRFVGKVVEVSVCVLCLVGKKVKENERK